MSDCVKYPTVYMHLKTTPSYIHSPRVETETKKFEYKYESTFSIENANLYNFNGNL